MVVFILGIYFGSGGISFNSLYKWLPLGIGVFLYGPFQYLYSKTGDKVNWLYIAVSTLGGLGFSLLKFTYVKEGPQMYMLAISGFFVLAGLVRFYLFTSKHPVLEVPKDE